MFPLLNRTKALALLFVACAFTAIALIVGLYLAWFWPSQLSNSPSDWGSFGDYVGGTLATVFSLLAFFGVLCTVWLQAMQLELATKQAQLDEIQRTLASLSNRIDQLLSESAHQRFLSQSLQAEDADFFWILSAGGTAAIAPKSQDWMKQARDDQVIGECKNALRKRAPIIGIELNQLAWLLNRYSAEGGADSVVTFYVRRYAAAVCWMDALEFLGKHEEVQRLFRPELLRESLTPDI